MTASLVRLLPEAGSGGRFSLKTGMEDRQGETKEPTLVPTEPPSPYLKPSRVASGGVNCSRPAWMAQAAAL